MKVWIDQDLCTGDGLCEEIAPAVFTLLDDGLAYVKEGDKVFSDPGGAEGLAEHPRRHARRGRRIRRGVPRRVHLHRGRVAVSELHRGTNTPSARPGSCRCSPASCEPSRATGRDLGVGERVGASRCCPGSIANAIPITSPLSFTSAPPESPGASCGREHVHVPAARTGAVDVGADREDLVADARRRGRERPAAGMAVHRADRPDAARRERERPARQGRAPTAPRRRGPDRRRRRSRRMCVAGVVLTVVVRSPATTCALVTTMPGAATQPLPSWIWCRTRAR